MWNKYFSILTGILLAFYHGNIHCYRKKIDQQFPLGAIGCLFADTQSLCDPGARCIDDHVFGICSSEKIPDNFADMLDNGFPDKIAYMLDIHGLEKLEKELLELVLHGFTWSDAYAQCVIQNVLVSLGTKQPFSKQTCLRLHLDWKTSVQNEVMSILETLNKKMGSLGKHTLTGNFENVPVITVSFDRMPLTISQKRDELIRVHKYFDKNEKIRKRLFAPSIRDFNFLSHDLRDMRLYPKSYQNHVNYNGVDKNLVSLYEDLLLVKDYLAASRNQQQTSRSPFSNSLLMPDQGQTIQLPMLHESFSLDNSSNNAKMKYQPFSSHTESLENLDEILPDVLGSISLDVLGSISPNVSGSISSDILGSVSPDVSANVKSADVVDTNFVALEMDHGFQGQKLKTKVDPPLTGVSASGVAKQAREPTKELEKISGITSDIENQTEVEIKSNDNHYFILTFVLCGFVTAILIVVVIIYLIQRNSQAKDKLKQLTAAQDGNESASNDYQDLCRQHMQSKSSEKSKPLHAAASHVGSVSETQVCSPTSKSSTSSWSEEPVHTNMDITTGHIVLSYVEDHLKNKDKLDHEWQAMCAYEADPCSTKVAEEYANTRKNRYGDALPYDHSRVVLNASTNMSGSDYINASTITDHDPRNPAYVATQGPLPHTVTDFWQMVWEQGSVAIIMLTKLTENTEVKCHRYWPEEGSDLYHIYEVHLVSEHIWCEDYLVRSFYLKNLQTSETRTITQFHFLTWPDLGAPSSIKALLEFKSTMGTQVTMVIVPNEIDFVNVTQVFRKVNKSYRGHSCPIVVHCSDGCGRTGTYCLIDLVLNRMTKGAKEIDIVATLEHIRDQRVNMVATKEQFQFALAAVAEEVHGILKALPQ